MTQLTTHNAQVTTATVEIQTLTVGGKQVTLSLFRQLPDRPVISGSGEWNGQPWGWVNYHPDKRCEMGSHLHVIWEDGGRLYRAREDPPDGMGTVFYPDAAEDLVQVLYCMAEHQDPPFFKRVHVAGGYTDIRFTIDGMACATVSTPKTCNTAYPPAGYNSPPPPEPCRTEADLGPCLTSVHEQVKTERADRERCLAAWRALTGLPQLFIAT